MPTRGIILGFLLTSLIGSMPQGFSAGGSTLTERAPDHVSSTVVLNVDEATKQRALHLLNQIIETSKDFEDKYLTAKIKADAADLFWSYDEPRARAMFEEAFASVEMVKSPDGDNKSHISDYVMNEGRTRLRIEILQLASQRDPNLARKLVKLANEPGDGVDRVSGCIGCVTQNEKARQYTRMALDALNKDTIQAGKLLRLAINEGLDSMMYSVLIGLRQKSPALADELFIQALSAARRNTPHLAPNVIVLVRYVFPRFGKGVLNPGPQADEGQETIVPASQETIKQFLIFARDALRTQANSVRAAGMNNGNKQLNRQLTYDYFVGEQLLAYVEKYLPDELANMRAHLQELLAQIPDAEMKAYLEEFNRERNSRGYVKVNEAELKPEFRENYYRQAIFRSLSAGSIEEALDFVSKLEDEQARAFFLLNVRRHKAGAALNKQDLDAAYNYAREIPEPHEQATLIGRIARSFHHRGEKTRAMELILEAEQLFQKSEDKEEKAKGLLELVYSSEQIDKDLGLRDLQAAVDAINAANIPVRWMSNKPLISKSTGKVVIEVENGLGIFRFDMGFQELARSDFSQAVQLAQAIKQKESSTLAQLAICRAVIKS